MATSASLDSIACLSQRWFDEVWNQRKPSTIDELATPEAKGHTEEGKELSLEEFKKFRAEFLNLIPDIQFTVEAIVSDGENVAIRWHATGTHKGEAFGLKATNQTIKIQGTTWHRFQDGKIVEGWDCWNSAEFFAKLQAASA